MAMSANVCQTMAQYLHYAADPVGLIKRGGDVMKDVVLKTQAFLP
jgi:hypothetical protein